MALSQQLRDSGIHLVVVGVGHHIDKKELQLIAGGPDKMSRDTQNLLGGPQNVFIADTDLDLLGTPIVDGVSKSVCKLQNLT